MRQPVEILGALIAIPSVNPMGRAMAGPVLYESRLTDHLQAQFEPPGRSLAAATGMPRRQHPRPVRGRSAARPGRYMDVALGGAICRIPFRVDGMTVDPFRPDIRQRRIYGRGACDVKGGMAAMLAAVERLLDERPAGRPTIVLACTVNEEFGFSGRPALCDSGHPAANRCWFGLPTRLSSRNRLAWRLLLSPTRVTFDGSATRLVPRCPQLPAPAGDERHLPHGPRRHRPGTIPA